MVVDMAVDMAGAMKATEDITANIMRGITAKGTKGTMVNTTKDITANIMRGITAKGTKDIMANIMNGITMGAIIIIMV